MTNAFQQHTDAMSRDASALPGQFPAPSPVTLRQRLVGQQQAYETAKMEAVAATEACQDASDAYDAARSGVYEALVGQGVAVTRADKDAKLDPTVREAETKHREAQRAKLRAEAWLSIQRHRLLTLRALVDLEAAR